MKPSGVQPSANCLFQSPLTPRLPPFPAQAPTRPCSIILDYLCSPFAFPAPCLAISLLECLLPLLSLPTPSSELYLMTPQLSFKAKFTAAHSSQLSILHRVPHVLLCETARRMLAQHAHIEDKLWVRLQGKCPEHKDV